MLDILLACLEEHIGLENHMKKLVIKNSPKKWYQEATKYLTTYYGQLAHKKVKPNQKFELDEQNKVNEKYKNFFIEKRIGKNCLSFR